MINLQSARLFWRQTVLIVAIVVVAVLLTVALNQLYNGLRGQGVDYVFGDTITEELCPGDDLVYRASIKASYVGPVHFVVSWCQDAPVPFCSSKNDLDYYQNITRTFPPTAFTVRIKTPENLSPGKYTFSRSVQRPGAATISDMLIVPFIVRSDCPAP